MPVSRPKARTHFCWLRRIRRVFTLVELLVVIAIISVLASMLLPVLNQATESAKEMDCANNLRQLSSCFHLYAQDFEGILPPISLVHPGVTNSWYYAVLINGGYTSKDPKKDIWLCRSTKKLQWNGGYGVNESHLLVYPTWGKPCKLGNLKRPSAYWLLGDVHHPSYGEDASWIATYCYKCSWKTNLNCQRPAPRHKGRTNVAYTDTHVGGLDILRLAASGNDDKLNELFYEAEYR